MLPYHLNYGVCLCTVRALIVAVLNQSYWGVLNTPDMIARRDWNPQYGHVNLLAASCAPAHLEYRLRLDSPRLARSGSRTRNHSCRARTVRARTHRRLPDR